MATERGENIETSHDEVQNPADRINFLMKQLSELNDAISEFRQRRNNWESSLSTLQISNWTKQIKNNELRRKEIYLRKSIPETMKIADDAEQELKNLMSQQIGVDFSKRYVNYTENFLCAYTEYSSGKLLKDIERYKHEWEKIQHELPTLIKEVESLEVKHGLNCSISDGHTEKTLQILELLNSTIVNYNNNKIQQIRIAQQTLRKLENKLNRKRTRLNYFRK